MREITRLTPLAVGFASRGRKTRLKPRKNQPNTRSMPRVSASFGASWAFSSSAASAGDSVSELKAEITVEIAIVSANCL